MSFRNDGNVSLRWRRWKTAHIEELLRCGLPDFVLETERDWIHLLEEGYDPVTGWSPAMLREDQQLALYHFVQRGFGNVTYRCMLHDLEKSLGIAPPIASD